jgi:hypothetical protein
MGKCLRSIQFIVYILIFKKYLTIKKSNDKLCLPMESDLLIQILFSEKKNLNDNFKCVLKFKKNSLCTWHDFLGNIQI